ncbi:MAG: hypothetical protein QXG12_05435 [Thermoproteota archaeon]
MLKESPSEEIMRYFSPAMGSSFREVKIRRKITIEATNPIPYGKHV